MKAKSKSLTGIISKPEKANFIPSNIKYYDDLLEKEFILMDHENSDVWEIHFNSITKKLDFLCFPEKLKILVKRYLANQLLKYTPESIISNFDSIKRFILFFGDPDSITNIKTPLELKNFYLIWLNSATGKKSDARKIINFLAFSAKFNMGGLTDKDFAQIKSWPSPKIIKHERALNGTYKLSFFDELRISQYLEDKIEKFQHMENPHDHERELLLDVALAICMSFGLRTKQLAMIKIGSIQQHGNDGQYFDIAIPIIKQRHRKKDFFRKALPTKWQFLITLWWEYRKSRSNVISYSKIPLLSTDDSIRPPAFYTSLIKEVTKKILMEEKTPYHFRHTFAQRMADSGASAAEISVALTQTTTESAQAYVNATSNMARIISEAIGKSLIYKDIPDLFSGRLIVRKDMLDASKDNLITGIVDGVVMPGIGLCSMTINMCERSPLLACHTCPKFMPLMEIEPHALLAQQLREVIFRFKSVCTDENLPSSPLKKMGQTLAVIEKLLQEINHKMDVSGI